MDTSSSSSSSSWSNPHRPAINKLFVNSAAAATASGADNPHDDAEMRKAAAIIFRAVQGHQHTFGTVGTTRTEHSIIWVDESTPGLSQFTL